jgi:dCMP deaminase
VSLEDATLYCTLEPCNWCFKQLIQAGIREIYFEIAYDSPNKEFDAFWRQTMQTHKGLRVFEQIPISEHARNLMLGVLSGDSNRKIASPETVKFPGFRQFILDIIPDRKGAEGL